MALHDPDSSIREEAMALKMGRRKRIQIIDGQQVEIYQSNDDSEEEEEDEDEEEYLEEVKPKVEGQGKRKELYVNVKGDDGQQYVVLEVIQMQDGEEEGQPKQEIVYDEDEEEGIEHIHEEDPMNVDNDFIIGDGEFF